MTNLDVHISLIVLLETDDNVINCHKYGSYVTKFRKLFCFLLFFFFSYSVIWMRTLFIKLCFTGGRY